MLRWRVAHLAGGGTDEPGGRGTRLRRIIPPRFEPGEQARGCYDDERHACLLFRVGWTRHYRGADKPIAALHDSLLPAGHLAHSVLSGVPKRLSRFVPSSDTRRPLCRVHALTFTVDAAPVRLQEIRSAYGSDCCSWLRCCYPACLHVTHCQKSSRRRRSRCHRASALHRERRCRRRGR